MFERVEAVDGLLEFQHRFNFFETESTDVQQLVVWGGTVANCGEDHLSHIVDRCADRLRRVVYCPARTKGGVLVRPKYYMGDRAGRQTFPQLTDLAIRLEPVLLPSQFGWITPALRRLRLLCVTAAVGRRRNASGGDVRDVRSPDLKDLQHWLSPGLRWSLSLPGQPGQHSWAADPKGAPRGPCLLEQLHQDCPELESVTVAICSTADADASMGEVEWLRLLPPQPVPWSVGRLLLLAALKPRSAAARSAEGGEVSRPERYESPLSMLGVTLLQLVFGFLGRQSWTCVDRGLEEEEARRAELPVDFRRVTALDVLSHSDPPRHPVLEEQELPLDRREERHRFGCVARGLARALAMIGVRRERPQGWLLAPSAASPSAS